MYLCQKNYCPGTVDFFLFNNTSFLLQPLSGNGMVGIRAVVVSFSFVTHSACESNMAIGGVVITVRPDDRRDLEIALAKFSELSVYGSDEKGNIIAMINGGDSGSIKKLIRTIEEIDAVHRVNLAYLNTENAPETSAVRGEQR